ncbi:hypothetical protein X797_009129 [Metarhizium robertsii]|uniref:Uncharacterized protein n=1 Tax=Metarhizium robertsii TaxID=568076 RepID=A0A0A1UQZ2_9HYPO|nr:hypothetical protein X797_009129 [Metarhizium robertsii]
MRSIKVFVTGILLFEPGSSCYKSAESSLGDDSRRTRAGRVDVCGLRPPRLDGGNFRLCAWRPAKLENRDNRRTSVMAVRKKQTIGHRGSSLRQVNPLCTVTKHMQVQSMGNSTKFLQSLNASMIDARCRTTQAIRLGNMHPGPKSHTFSFSPRRTVRFLAAAVRPGRFQASSQEGPPSVRELFRFSRITRGA